MVPFLICTVLGFIFAFIQICAFGWTGVTPAFFGAVADFYMFVTMYSLYKRLQYEEVEQTKFIQRISAISRV